MPRGRDLFLSMYNRLMVEPVETEGMVTPIEYAMQRIMYQAGDDQFTIQPRESHNLCIIRDMRNCARCGTLVRRSVAMRCSACRTAYYCSAGCHRTHWPEHKLQCWQKPTKDQRRNLEANDTASRIMWECYCTPLPFNGPFCFEMGGTDCHMTKTKPESQSKHMTVVLMTRNEKLKGVFVTYIDPLKLIRVLKEILRWTCNSECERLSSTAQGYGKNYGTFIKLYRDTIISIHKEVKLMIKTSGPEQNHNFMIITPLQNKHLWFKTFSLLRAPDWMRHCVDFDKKFQ